MRNDAIVHRLAPAWARTLAAMRGPRTQVRSQCRRCGALMREDVDALIGLHSGQASLIDRQARCRMVGCDGATFYLAARGLEGSWHELLHDDALRTGLGDGPPAHGADGRPVRSAPG